MTLGVDRMQSPADRARVEDVLAWIDAHVVRLGAEDVPLAQAAGRIVADDVRTAIDVPSFDRAAVDGVALLAEETIGASTYNPLPFRLVPVADDLAPGSAVRVHAGDRLPQGADAVVALEQVEDDSAGVCSIMEAVVAGTSVERAGSHGTRGRTLAAPGRRLSAADIGFLAASGIAHVSAVRRPRVRCLLTGRHVIETGRPLSPDAVHDANGPLLGALIERDGGLVIEQRRVGRDTTPIRSALIASGPEIILVVGSSGPGCDDHPAAALAEAGELVVHGVALRPADTLGMGRTAAGIPVFLLPGSPVACLWGYELFAGRAIRRLGGRNPALPFASRPMTVAKKIVSEIGMTEVCPVRCPTDGEVEPIASFAEAGLAAATRADGFVLVPEGSEGYPQGASVTVYLYHEQNPTHS